MDRFLRPSVNPAICLLIARNAIDPDTNAPVDSALEDSATVSFWLQGARAAGKQVVNGRSHGHGAHLYLIGVYATVPDAIDSVQ